MNLEKTNMNRYDVVVNKTVTLYESFVSIECGKKRLFGVLK
ncbi:hypothetical protein CHCC20335_0043 [Bacillus paralicheniformis]|nr:hypothetical protein CHCC20335_0043 [Bacillus paralicheniformis]